LRLTQVVNFRQCNLEGLQLSHNPITAPCHDAKHQQSALLSAKSPCSKAAASQCGRLWNSCGVSRATGRQPFSNGPHVLGREITFEIS
jgi:hypothetical protein